MRAPSCSPRDALAYYLLRARRLSDRSDPLLDRLKAAHAPYMRTFTCLYATFCLAVMSALCSVCPIASVRSVGPIAFGIAVGAFYIALCAYLPRRREYNEAMSRLDENTAMLGRNTERVRKWTAATWPPAGSEPWD